MTNKKTCSILSILISVALMLGCQTLPQSALATETQGILDDSDENAPISIDLGNDECERNHIGDEDADVFDDGKLNKEPISNENLEQWVGKYSFWEYVPPDIGSPKMMDYLIDIYNENGDYYANITIDGWQTMDRWKAQVAGDSKFIELSFYEYLPGSFVSEYMPIDVGTILICFERKDSDMLTYWGRLKPILLVENEASGKVYFELIE